MAQSESGTGLSAYLIGQVGGMPIADSEDEKNRNEAVTTAILAEKCAAQAPQTWT